MPGLPNGYPKEVSYISETWTENELGLVDIRGMSGIPITEKF
jgi:hypothetical protein